MALVVDVIQELLLAVEGAPEPLAVTAYVEAARRLCRNAGVWRETVSATLGSNTAEYLLTPPTDGQVFDAVSVKLGEKWLDKRTREQLEVYGLPGYRVFNNTLVLNPDPQADVSANLTIVARIRPIRSATTLPDDLVDEHHDGLLHGALYRLLSYPNKSWSDYDMASFHYRRFNDYIDEWTSRAADDGMTGVPRKVRYGGI